LEAVFVITMLLCAVTVSTPAARAAQVRKIKRRACEYDYVEVMACPGACLNGGGQLPPVPGQSAAQLLDQLDQVYHDPQVRACAALPYPNPDCRGIAGAHRVLACPMCTTAVVACAAAARSPPGARRARPLGRAGCGHGGH